LGHGFSFLKINKETAFVAETKAALKQTNKKQLKNIFLYLSGYTLLLRSFLPCIKAL